MAISLFAAADLSPGTGRCSAPSSPTARWPRSATAWLHLSGAFRVRSIRRISERGSKVSLHGSRDHASSRSVAIELQSMSTVSTRLFEIAATRDGTIALEPSGPVVDSFSIGFRESVIVDGDVVVRTEAALMEVSLVGMPAYPGALVAGVRSVS